LLRRRLEELLPVGPRRHRLRRRVVRGAEVVEDAGVRRQLAERLLVELFGLDGLPRLHLLVPLGDVGLLARDRIPRAEEQENQPPTAPHGCNGASLASAATRRRRIRASAPRHVCFAARSPPHARACSFFSRRRSPRQASMTSSMNPGKRRNWYASLGMLSTRSSRLPSFSRASAFTTASTLNPRGAPS